ncbi:OsmC family protein [Phaeacidiphilus oryzae]|uniref:OsmC family protein n=1 Tax=Phaeacidiphilus oryzae TaxID=348818 RepID=UPI00056C192C|nr:OsmC family protein [Phaeacidiphilus oryzae]
MATTRVARTAWEGGLQDGKGTVTFASSGIGDYQVSWPSRAEQPNGQTSPEELIAAAHSSCFSMALSHGLTQAGHPPTRLDTQAEVTFQPGTGITAVKLTVRGEVPGLDAAGFTEAAQDAKANCPVSQLMKGNVEVALDASLA